MSKNIESFKSELGQVEIDTKKKSITIDGKPLAEVITEKSAMELLIKDLAIDREIMTTLKRNATNFKSHLLGIGNRQVREIARNFVEDLQLGFQAMIAQRNLQMITLIRMEKKWLENQASAPAAAASKLTDSTPSTSSAPVVLEQALSQPEFQ